LKTKLRQLLRKQTSPTQVAALADFVKKYDWKNLRYDYAAAFEQLR